MSIYTKVDKLISKYRNEIADNEAKGKRYPEMHLQKQHHNEQLREVIKDLKELGKKTASKR